MGTRSTRTARSTPDQRATLRRVEADLKEALESAQGRFYVTPSTVEAYILVLTHLRHWNQWEADDDL